MSYQLVGDFLTLPANVDLSASFQCAVDVTTGSKWDLPAAGGGIMGVLVDKQVAGQALTAQIAGIAQWKLGGTVAPKDYVKVDSAGRAVTASAGDVALGKSVGRCVEGGDINEIGAIMLSTMGAGFVAVTGSESIATSVDVSVLTEETLITVAAGDLVGTLDDGKYVGQRKRVRCVLSAGTNKYTLTPDTVRAGTSTTFVFNRTGQYLELTWSATGWWVSDVKPAGVETVSASGTINLLCAIHLYAVADTVDIIIPNGWVPMHQAIVGASANSGSPVGTTSGLFYDEDFSADGIDLNFNAAADAGVLLWDGFRWYAIALTSATIST